MKPLEHALELASRGFWVFPLKVGQKKPLHQGWQNEATTDPDAIRAMWRRDFNVGIFTEKFGSGGKALCVLDVDDKHGKKGSLAFLQLDIDGFEFPRTLTHRTPSGGRHLIYVCDTPMQPGTDVLGEGLDIRSGGSYIAAPGCALDEYGGKGYEQIEGGAPVQLPEWAAGRIGQRRIASPRASDRKPLEGIVEDKAATRAAKWLQRAPVATQDQGGDIQTFKTAATVKDMGCSQEVTFALMLEHWNDRCLPPWDRDELETKVANAFNHGQNAQGSAAPEAIFPPLPLEFLEAMETPVGAAKLPKRKSNAQRVLDLNEEWALVLRGATVLRFSTDQYGQKEVVNYSLTEFHAWFANQRFAYEGERMKTLSLHWLEDGRRRQYEGVVFCPQQDAGPRWYNLWQGFTVKPVEGPANHPSLDAFLDHALNNVCSGNAKEFNWLMGFFAHLIQKPWEKPLVAVVMQGLKGCGKNALVERVGALVGQHSLLASNDRYLMSNFNSHMENNLLFILDEASWAGDKKAEGRLKDLITGTRHNIERKGCEPYMVTNLCRVIILGNETWMVPATQDERRFAVFAVREGRMANGSDEKMQFFEKMRVGMENGGYAHLLRYLLDFDLSPVNVNKAPRTFGLSDQQIANQSPLGRWWYECLAQRTIVEGDWAGEWPDAAPTSRFMSAFQKWARSRQIRSQLEGPVAFGKFMHAVAPNGLKHVRSRPENPKDSTYEYRTSSIDVLREDFAAYLKSPVKWADG